jgi:hypothetical protein
MHGRMGRGTLLCVAPPENKALGIDAYVHCVPPCVPRRLRSRPAQAVARGRPPLSCLQVEPGRERPGPGGDSGNKHAMATHTHVLSPVQCSAGQKPRAGSLAATYMPIDRCRGRPGIAGCVVDVLCTHHTPARARANFPATLIYSSSPIRPLLFVRGSPEQSCPGFIVGTPPCCISLMLLIGRRLCILAACPILN